MNIHYGQPQKWLDIDDNYVILIVDLGNYFRIFGQETYI